MSELLKLHRGLRCGVALALVAFAMGALAKDAEEEIEWREIEVPAPPAFKKDGLLGIEMPSYVSLKLGVDPATLAIGADGVLRYVVVAVNPSGSVMALYEGIRCATGQVKSYARAGDNGKWVMSKTPLWRDLTDNLPSKHALAFARQAACEGRSEPVSSVADVIKSLKR